MNNAFQAIMGANTPIRGEAVQSPPSAMNGGMGGIFGRMQQIANMVQNPQQLVQRYFPDAPAELSGNPEQLLQWMQQTGKVTPQMVQMARQMMGR